MDIGIKVALAQIPVVRGDMSVNLSHHLTKIEHASAIGADVVVFPELSLTGYELDLLGELTVTESSSVVKSLSKASIDNDIIAIAGCTRNVIGAQKPMISAVICFPDGEINFYAKQHLHEGENQYCSSGAVDYYFEVKGYQVALAICADFVEPAHSKKARAHGADIYIASALISEAGFETDAEILANIAATNCFPVLLCNHISKSGGWSTCGNNSVWSSTGEHVFSSESKDSCLVICSISGTRVEASKT
ncbi:Predicted amidohydrolase [Ferrimonas marina]|uniref:Predicted amidohydrolase n=1 Tax=Ferrimonas marina TaxID=299255 RepID=A0A1M5N6G4_9GAMM|nr:Predicted amidohydrolase [Ferrimonas marina]